MIQKTYRVYVDASFHEDKKFGAYCIYFNSDDFIIEEIHKKVRSVNEAEFLAIIEALKCIKIRGIARRVLLYNDNLGTVCKFCNNNNYRLEKVKKEIGVANVSLYWIPRKQNKAGRILSRKWTKKEIKDRYMKVLDTH